MWYTIADRQDGFAVLDPEGKAIGLFPSRTSARDEMRWRNCLRCVSLVIENARPALELLAASMKTR